LAWLGCRSEAEGAERGWEGGCGGESVYVVAVAEPDLAGATGVVHGDGLAGVVSGEPAKQWQRVVDLDRGRGVWYRDGLVGGVGDVAGDGQFEEVETERDGGLRGGPGRRGGRCRWSVETADRDVPAFALDEAGVSGVGGMVGDGDGDGQPQPEHESDQVCQGWNVGAAGQHEQAGAGTAPGGVGDVLGQRVGVGPVQGDQPVAQVVVEQATAVEFHHVLWPDAEGVGPPGEPELGG